MRIARSSVHWPLFGLVTFLTIVGLVNLYSALHLWGGGSLLRLFWLQLIWVGLGAVIGGLFHYYDYRLLPRWAPHWFIGTIVALLLVLFVGRVVGGNRNWLGFMGFGIQPSEFAKLVVLVILAKFFTDRAQPKGYRLADLVRPVGVLLLVVALVALGGDLGTTLFLMLVGGSIICVAGLKWRSMIVVVLIATAAGLTAYQTVLTPTQRARVTTFLHPEADPRGKGYHMLQSRIAIGSGQLWGRGFLRGTVNKLRYLPEKHTDFVFPVLAEEWGFVGCTLVVLAYALLIIVALGISQNAGDRFGAFLAAGIALWFFWQVAINLGGVLGLMPLTGVTLPFLSYGGSSMLVTFAAIGLLFSIHRRRYLF